MHRKSEIFEDIVYTLKHDYAGFEEKIDCHQPDLATITDDMDDVDFLKAVQRYLYAFNDGHLSFGSTSVKLPFRGFRVRRFEQSLYVTEILGENRLQIGDQIISINNETISQVANRYAVYLQSDINERQLWNNVLPLAETITYIRYNVKHTITLKEYERPSYIPEYSFKQLEEKIAYIKLTDFLQGEPILKMIQDNEQQLENVSTIIFDVRVNYGGNDMFYFPLIPYAIDNSISTINLAAPDEYMMTNYTARNCDLRIQTLEEFLNQPLDEQTRTVLLQEIEKYKTNYDKGLQRIEDSLDMHFEPKGNTQQIYILTDITCGSSGESFVKNLRYSPKVKVVGRGTMGILDYFNVTSKSYGDFTLNYSVSKLNPKYYKNDTGEVPDIHIPWTPKHLIEDIDLKYVLSLCTNPLTNK